MNWSMGLVLLKRVRTSFNLAISVEQALTEGLKKMHLTDPILDSRANLFPLKEKYSCRYYGSPDPESTQLSLK